MLLSFLSLLSLFSARWIVVVFDEGRDGPGLMYRGVYGRAGQANGMFVLLGVSQVRLAWEGRFGVSR